MVLKDNSAKQILIAAVITITLQSGIVAGIALHGSRISHVEDVVHLINKNYIPAFFLEGIIQNMNYQTEEIVATMNGDAEKIHQINVKYIEFQKTMIKSLNEIRSSITDQTRSLPEIKIPN